jgi:hypothetical protein
LNFTKRPGCSNIGSFHPIEKTIQVWKLNEQGIYIGLQPKVEGDIVTTPIIPNLAVDVTEVFLD